MDESLAVRSATGQDVAIYHLELAANLLRGGQHHRRGAYLLFGADADHYAEVNKCRAVVNAEDQMVCLVAPITGRGPDADTMGPVLWHSLMLPRSLDDAELDRVCDAVDEWAAERDLPGVREAGDLRPIPGVSRRQPKPTKRRGQ